jgi:rubrerythrin
MRIQEKEDKLVIVDFDEFEAYRIACKIEKDGMMFYKKLASEVKNNDVRQALDFLLGEERKHLQFFEDVLSRIRHDREDTAEDNDLLTSMDFGIFQPYQGIAQLQGIVEDTSKALRLGIAIENKSIKFYQACLQNVSAPQTKSELGLIIEEEKRHKDLLDTFLAALPKDKK